MPPRKRARQGSPGDKSREGDNVAQADVEPARRSSWSTQGTGGHAAQLQKAGETLTAPTRRKKASNDLDISDSEENPMAPLQLKRRRKKVAAFYFSESTQLTNICQASTPNSSVEPNSSWPESERARLHIARPSDRFGFKPPQSQATHPISHNHKEAGSEVAERNLENHSRSGDLGDFDESGKSADEHKMQDERRAADNDFGEHDDEPALTDSLIGGDGDDLMEFDESQPGRKDERTGTIPYDVLKHHQAKNGRRKAPSPTHLSSNSHSHTLTHNPSARLKSPHQYSPKHVPRRRSFETRASSARLKSPQCAPRKAPSAEAGSTRGLCIQAEVMIPPPAYHLLIDAPRLGQQPFVLAQGLHIQAEVMITLPADCLLIDAPRLSQQPFSLAQDLHVRIYSMDHLLVDIPRCDHHIGKPLNPITRFLIPLFQAALILAAKLEMRLQAVLTHPIPEHQNALQLAREVLDAVLWNYHSKTIKMENGYFPEYRAQMSRLLCDDLFTFCMELKKIVLSIVKQMYGIFPKGNIAQKDALQWHITEAASKLIKSGDYLQLPDSSVGKYKNFVSQVLKDACLDFYYGNGKKALKLTEKFQKMMPVNALILVGAVAKGILTGFHKTGTDKVPDLSADKCRSDFDSLRKSVDKLMDIPERRQELESMLEEWADVGMMGESWDDSDAGSDDVNIIL
ncbi:hypothetical protein DFH29DRAFT_881291 [Suillus ampliporus]|nr:hypothetical protein DFH29DRAFT_881291 [Suillus ampliporus]